MRKIMIYFLFFILVSCNSQLFVKNENFDNNSIRIYYFLDILGDMVKSYPEEKDTLFVERQIFVSDSCFGAYTRVNEKKAFQYLNELSDKNEQKVNLHYDIKIKNNGKDYFLFKVIQDIDILADIILQQGYTLKINSDNSYATTDKKFLQITNKYIGKNDFYSLNFEIDKSFNPKLISKEKLNTETQKYCVDSINKELSFKNNEREIIFTEAFHLFMCDKNE